MIKRDILVVLYNKKLSHSVNILIDGAISDRLLLSLLP